MGFPGLWIVIFLLSTFTHTRWWIAASMSSSAVCWLVCTKQKHICPEEEMKCLRAHTVFVDCIGWVRAYYNIYHLMLGKRAAINKFLTDSEIQEPALSYWWTNPNIISDLLVMEIWCDWWIDERRLVVKGWRDYIGRKSILYPPKSIMKTSFGGRKTNWCRLVAKSKWRVKSLEKP